VIETTPLPATDDPTDEAFWSATLRSKLVVQKCDQCLRLRFPPRPMCPYCQALNHTWTELSGDASVWSFATPRPPLLPAFEALMPYVVVLAQLAEDPTIRIIGNLIAQPGSGIARVDTSQLEIGAKLRVAFRHCATDVALPCWVLAGEATPESRDLPMPTEQQK